MTAARLKLGEILVRTGVLTGPDVEKVLARQAEAGGRFGSLCMDLGLAAEAEVAAALSEQRDLPVVVLGQSVIAVGVLELLPVSLAKRGGVLALEARGERLLIASADPLEEEIEDEVRFMSGRRPQGHLVLAGRLERALDEAEQALTTIGSTRVGGWDVPELEHEAFRIAVENPPESPRAEMSEVLPGTREQWTDTREPEPAPEEGSIPDDTSDSSPPAAERNLRVLVVDDEEDIRATLKMLLEEPGTEVLTCGDGSEALEVITTSQPDLIVLDAMLPGLHGFEVCRLVKGSVPFAETPIIMISAVHRGPEVAKEVKELYNAEEYFEKPLDIDRFCLAVRAHLPLHPSPLRSIDAMVDEGMEYAANGDRLLEQGLHQRAAEQLEKAIRLLPFNSRLHYLCGVAYRELDRSFDAMTSLEKAIELDKGFFSALRDLAVLYEQSPFRRKSKELWRRALEFAPHKGVAELIRGHLAEME